MVEFEYLNRFGLKRTAKIDYPPLEIKPPEEGIDIFRWENNNTNALYFQWRVIQSAFDFDMKNIILVEFLFYEIKYLGIEVDKWFMEGTAKKMDYWFLEPVTTEPLLPRIKYKFKLTAKGIELFNLIDSLFVITDFNKDIVKADAAKTHEYAVKNNILK